MYCNNDNIWSVIDLKIWQNTYLKDIKEAFVITVEEDTPEFDKEILLSRFNDMYIRNVTIKSPIVCIPIVTRYRDKENLFNDDQAYIIYDKSNEGKVNNEYLEMLFEGITKDKDIFLVTSARDYKAQEGELLLHTSYRCPWKKR